MTKEEFEANLDKLGVKMALQHDTISTIATFARGKHKLTATYSQSAIDDLKDTHGIDAESETLGIAIKMIEEEVGYAMLAENVVL